MTSLNYRLKNVLRKRKNWQYEFNNIDENFFIPIVNQLRRYWQWKVLLMFLNKEALVL